MHASTHIQEILGYPVRLVASEQVSVENDYANMASGEYHMYPEVWKSEEHNEYEKYVVDQKTVVSSGHLGVFGRNGWYALESEFDKWPSLASWRGLHNPEVKRHFNSTIYAFEPEWGSEEALMKNLELGYIVQYMGGAEGERVLKYAYRMNS